MRSITTAGFVLAGALAAACGARTAVPTPVAPARTATADTGRVLTVVAQDSQSQTAVARAEAKVTPSIPATLSAPAALMFCVPLQQGGYEQPGLPLATVPDGSKVYYEPGTCQPNVDASGAVALKDAAGNIARNPDGTIRRVTPTYTTAYNTESVVWTPAKGDLNGAPTIMTAKFLMHNARVQMDQLGQSSLVFNMTQDGKQVFGSLTRRIGAATNGLPLALFLDGKPLRGGDGKVIAPRVMSPITDTGTTTGLHRVDAQRLAGLLDSGMLR
ncbi:MAG: hypothetical protein KGK07_09820 [Chloroflexota bacterium]|nr:hypothetical protein [Chloroflexota bacterium]